MKLGHSKTLGYSHWLESYQPFHGLSLSTQQWTFLQTPQSPQILPQVEWPSQQTVGNSYSPFGYTSAISPFQVHSVQSFTAAHIAAKSSAPMSTYTSEQLPQSPVSSSHSQLHTVKTNVPDVSTSICKEIKHTDRSISQKRARKLWKCTSKWGG